MGLWKESSESLPCLQVKLHIPERWSTCIINEKTPENKHPVRNKAANLPHFWPLISVFFIYLPLLISWGGRDGCKHAQNRCQVWGMLCCSPSSGTHMDEPNNLGLSKENWHSHIFQQILLGNFSSWSFTQGLDWSMVRATLHLEFCKEYLKFFLSEIISYDGKLLMGNFTGQTHILLFP